MFFNLFLTVASIEFCIGTIASGNATQKHAPRFIYRNFRYCVSKNEIYVLLNILRANHDGCVCSWFGDDNGTPLLTYKREAPHAGEPN